MKRNSAIAVAIVVLIALLSLVVFQWRPDSGTRLAQRSNNQTAQVSPLESENRSIERHLGNVIHAWDTVRRATLDKRRESRWRLAWFIGYLERELEQPLPDALAKTILNGTFFDGQFRVGKMESPEDNGRVFDAERRFWHPSDIELITSNETLIFKQKDSNKSVTLPRLPVEQVIGENAMAVHYLESKAVVCPFSVATRQAGLATCYDLQTNEELWTHAMDYTGWGRSGAVLVRGDGSRDFNFFLQICSQSEDRVLISAVYDCGFSFALINANSGDRIASFRSQ